MEQTQLQRQLLDCLTVDLSEKARTELAQLPAETWSHLCELAVAQKMLPLLWQRLKSHGLLTLIPAAIQGQWQRQIYAMTVRNLRLSHELGIILSAVRAHQIPVIVLKGANLATTVYPHQALRMMSDIDLLFAPADVPAVVEILSGLGYRSERLLLLESHFAISHHLPRFVKADAVVSVEVHWSITRPGKFYAINTAELWTRAIPVSIAGVDVLAFCLEDLLLHVCTHATYQHRFMQGLRFLCDIDTIVRQATPGLDWTQVQQRALAWGWSRGVYLALYLAQVLFATPIPAATLQALQPAGNHQLIITAAMNEMLAEKAGTYAISPDFMRLWSDQRFYAQARRLLRSVFLPRAVMANLYPAAPNSLKLYLYYPVRLKDLLVHYSGKIWQHWRKDPQITSLVWRRQTLLDWLEQA